MKNKNSYLVFGVLFLLAVLSRCWAHNWNMTLAGAAFLFAGAYFKDKKVSVLLMLSAMLVSDTIIGFHEQMPSVYLAYLLFVFIGFGLKVVSPRLRVLGFSFLASVAFYLITNFAVWAEGVLYPLTLAGLVESYVMAIPFFKNQIIGDVLAAFALFEVAKLVLAEKTEKAEAN